jgi:hypothetical protein
MLTPEPPSLRRRLILWLRRYSIIFRHVTSGFTASFRWLSEKVWTWHVISLITVLLYGLGVNALYGNDFKVAATFYFVATFLLVTKTWGEAGKHPNSGGIRVWSILIGAGVFGLSLLWIKHRTGLIVQAPSRTEAVKAPAPPGVGAGETFVFLWPIRNLVNGYRPLLVEQRGPNFLNNVDVSLHDNKSGRGITTHYPEIDPGPQNPLAPRVVWWRPLKPGDENYGILIRAREGGFNEQVIVETAKGSRQMGWIVTVAGTKNILSECRDPLLSAQLPWDNKVQACSSSTQPKDLVLTPPSSPTPPVPGSSTAQFPTIPKHSPNLTGHADLKLEFLGKDKLQFMYFDDAEESANQPKRFFALWDIDRPFYYQQLPGVVQPLPLLVKVETDFVFRRSRQGPQDVLDSPDAVSHVKYGDGLFGVGYVVCSNCQNYRFYWIYFRLGFGGWYAETDNALWGQQIQVPKEDSTDEQRLAIFDAHVPRERRISIPGK